MASQRHEHHDFPVVLFVHQYSDAYQRPIQARQVRVHALRSKKHAAVELSLSNDVNGSENEPRNIIVKHFSDADKRLLHHESAVYAHAASAGVPVPTVLHVLDNFLVLDRVEGVTLMDLVNDKNILLERKMNAVQGLGAWLGTFHVAFATHPGVKRRGDTNLRNFIMTVAGTIVGLDLEEASLGDTSRDLHEAVDSILQSSPGIYTDTMAAIGWKFDLCACLLRGYAKVVRKPLDAIISDPGGFVDTQLQAMLDLAAIRGNTSALLPLVPGIKKELLTRISSLLPGRGR
nr:hypothetical protein [Candidatus Sigynarchaeum springense]